jgi:hypothetical protein
MTEEQYHVHDLLAAYVLGAVTPLEATLVEEHLATCALCRHQESEFREVERILPRLAGELAPPPALKTRLMSIVEAEPRSRDSADTALGETRETEHVAPVATMSPRRSMAAPARWNAVRRLSPILAVAAALLLVALGIGLWRAVNGGTQRPTYTYAVRSTAPGQSRLGTLAYYQNGKRLELTLHGLTKTDASHVYELWLIRVQGGKPVAVKGVKVFQASDGTGHLSASGQDIRGYNAAGLTVERHFNPTTPTLPIVATAAI